MHPSKEEFLKATGGTRAMPVYRDILADVETPLSAYWKLAEGETYSFLLESVTGGEQLARYSILGARPRLVLRTKGSGVRRITRNGEQHGELPDGMDPLALLEEELAGAAGRIPFAVGRPDQDANPQSAICDQESEISNLKSQASDPRSPIADTRADIRNPKSKIQNPKSAIISVPGMPKFIGGAVGMLAYDLVRFLEKLPDGQADDEQIDDMAMMLTESVVVFDHAKNLIRIIVVAQPGADGYEAACAEIERVALRLKRPLPELPRAISGKLDVSSNQTKEQFEEACRTAIGFLQRGDGIQVVLSQRLKTPSSSHPLTVYRALRSLNPSPYMFLLRFGDFDLVGASPELLFGLSGRTARVRPIAGTRWRGETPEEDAALEKELLADEKERAEHIMLVDLSRNDLGRVSEYGSVKVNDLMVIERYSHVMHIVSDVTGTLMPGKTAFDVIRSAFPHGTVSGAPKVKAMQIIDELEPTRRGPYAGGVGYIGLNGDMDLAIAIRTILLKGGTAYVQSGAGVVFDSVPEREYEETMNKAKAALRALEIAASGEV